MSKNMIGIIIAFLIGALLISCGKRSGNIINNVGEVDGGTNESHNILAPKSVSSPEISSLYFYIEDSFFPQGRIVAETFPSSEKEYEKQIRKYLYDEKTETAELKNIYDSEDTKKLFEDADYMLYLEIVSSNEDKFAGLFPVNQELMDKIAVHIAESEIMKENGKSRHTDGLPPKAGSFSLRAKFLTGESYDYSYNGGINELSEEFTKEFLKIIETEIPLNPIYQKVNSAMNNNFNEVILKLDSENYNPVFNE